MGEQLAIIGLMAGTSVDGIDTCLLWSDGVTMSPSNFAETFAYHPRTREEIFKAYEAPQKVHPELANWVARDHAHAVERLMINSGIKPDVIGFHGQTIFHDPKNGISVQIGDAQYLADRIGVNVVHQFRQADLKAGGQGAPLAPIYHQMIMAEKSINLPAAIVNIGGISNASLWDGTRLLGFDTGPGNALIDDAMMRLYDMAMDKDGAFAAKGAVDHSFIKRTLTHPYFHHKGAKSLDRAALYDWIDLTPLSGHTPHDQLASLTALTAASITAGLKANSDHLGEVIITGGGSHNPILLEMIKSYSGATVTTLESYGLDPDFTEAELMAVLAARHLNDLPITFPDTTGVNAPISGGVLVRPRLK